MLSMLGKNFSRRYFEIFFLFLSRNIFSDLSSTEFAQRVVMVKLLKLTLELKTRAVTIFCSKKRHFQFALVLLNKLPYPLLIVSQSDYLSLDFDTNSHTE